MADVNQLRADVARVLQQQDQIQNSILQLLQGQIGNHDQDPQAHAGRIAALETSVSRIESNIATLQQGTVDLDGRVTTQSQSIAQLEVSVGAVQQAIADLGAKLNITSRDLSKVNDKVDAVAADGVGTRLLLDEAEKQVATLKKSGHELHQRFYKDAGILNQRFPNLEAKANELDQLIKQLNARTTRNDIHTHSFCLKSSPQRPNAGPRATSASTQILLPVVS